MSRKSVVLIAAAAGLSSAVVAANIARSGAVGPYQTRADFDQVFKAAGASAEARPNSTPSNFDRRA